MCFAFEFEVNRMSKADDQCELDHIPIQTYRMTASNNSLPFELGQLSALVSENVKNLSWSHVLDFVVEGPLFPTLFFFHVLNVALTFNAVFKKKFWLGYLGNELGKCRTFSHESIAATFAVSVAGESTAYYLLGECPPWLQSDAKILFIVVVWYVIRNVRT